MLRLLIQLTLITNRNISAKRCRFKSPDCSLIKTSVKGYEYDTFDVDHLYKRCPDLESLTIEGVSVSKIPEGLSKFKSLKSLILKDIWKLKLPNDLGDITELTSLQLINIQLQKLPSSIQRLSNLNSLTLDYNSLTEIPDVVGELTALKELSINYNFIEDLPESIQNLKNLDVLFINNNKLENVPNCVFGLDLSYIEMKKNLIKNFPIALLKQPRLYHLNLDNNNIPVLPKELKELLKFKGLFISGNCYKQSIAELFVAYKRFEGYITSYQYNPDMPKDIKVLLDKSIIDFSGDKPIYIPTEILQPTCNKDFKNFLASFLYLKNSESIFSLQEIEENEKTMQNFLDIEKKKTVPELNRSLIDFKLSNRAMHWNKIKLRCTIRLNFYQDYVLDSSLIDNWNSFLDVNVTDCLKRRVLTTFFNSFHLPSSDNNKKSKQNEPIIEVSLYALIKALMLPRNKEKVRDCVDILCNYIVNDQTKILDVIDYCFSVYLGCQHNPNYIITDFIDNFIEVQKNIVFEGIVRPEKVCDFVDNYYFWKDAMRYELGFYKNTNVYTTYINMDTYQNNSLYILDEYYKLLTPEKVIALLTVEINKSQKLVGEVYDALTELDIVTDEMFLLESNDQSVPTEVTTVGIERYLFENGFIEYFDTKISRKNRNSFSNIR